MRKLWRGSFKKTAIKSTKKLVSAIVSFEAYIANSLLFLISRERIVNNLVSHWFQVFQTHSFAHWWKWRYCLATRSVVQPTYWQQGRNVFRHHCHTKRCNVIINITITLRESVLWIIQNNFERGNWWCLRNRCCNKENKFVRSCKGYLRKIFISIIF